LAFGFAFGAMCAGAGFQANEAVAASQCGKASWYKMGSRTASGEAMNAAALAAAHRTLPFGTKVRVENLGNGRSVVVRINDRGPFVRGRVIDVTRGAAERLGMIRSGTARVKVTVVGGGPSLDGCG
jgi:rare lipoprotein A